jgi:predicted transcriptional regulator
MASTHRQASRRQRLLAHPATLALAAAGSSTNDLADALGVTQSMASRYLSGRVGTPERLPETLRELIGADAARNVLALIPERDSQAPA